MSSLIRINIEEFLELHRTGAPIPVDDFKNLTDQLLLGKKYAYVKSEFIDTVLTNERDMELRDKEYNEISSLRLQAIEEEKKGNLLNAISLLSSCIELGENTTHKMPYAYLYAYERIIIDLHKAKEFDREKEYIERFLSYDTISETKRVKYSKRLLKLK